MCNYVFYLYVLKLALFPSWLSMCHPSTFIQVRQIILNHLSNDDTNITIYNVLIDRKTNRRDNLILFLHKYHVRRLFCLSLIDLKYCISIC